MTEITKTSGRVWDFAEAAAEARCDSLYFVFPDRVRVMAALIRHRIWHTLSSYLNAQHIPTGTHPLEHTSVHKQRSNCRGLETNVPQRHLSRAGCDVTWLQIVSLALIFSRGRKRRDLSARCKAARGKNGFCPSVWEIYHSVFTSHSVLLTPHLQQSKCYHCTKWAGMHVSCWRRAPQRKSTVKQEKRPSVNRGWVLQSPVWSAGCFHLLFVSWSTGRINCYSR